MISLSKIIHLFEIDKWSKGNNCIVFNLPDRLQVVDNPHLGVIYVFQRVGFRENVLTVHMNRLSSTRFA